MHRLVKVQQKTHPFIQEIVIDLLYARDYVEY